MNGGFARFALYVILVAIAGSAAADRSAAAISEFWQAPEPGLEASGSARGELNNPLGVAASPVSPGHVFVADRINARVSEFTAWGEFVKAWGWDVAPDGAQGDTVADQFEICTVTCQAGTEGVGSGQFGKLLGGIAVDEDGSIYVGDLENARVQKFTSDGQFVWMVGGEVNQGKSAMPGSTEEEKNLCTAVSGEICGGGTFGEALGQFRSGGVGTYLAIQSGNILLVGDTQMIHRFARNGSVLANYPDPSNLLSAGSVRALAVDTNGSLYIAFSGEDDILKLDVAGNPVSPEEIPAAAPSSIAADDQGQLYAISQGPTFGSLELLGFAPDGTCLSGMCTGSGFASKSDGSRLIAVASGWSCDGVYVAHYANTANGDKSYVTAYGPPPDPASCGDPPHLAPVIAEPFVASVDRGSVELRVGINPRFWSDTTYRVEYGSEPCSLDSCLATDPQNLTDAVINAFIPTATTINGLMSDHTYFYRFIAESGGGGPIQSVEGTFRTFSALELPRTSCINDLLRTGASAWLPDCRAFEMVSPIEKNGGDAGAVGKGGIIFSQTASSGNKMVYSSVTPYGEPKGAPFQSQYLARREGGSWLNESLAPPRGEPLTSLGLLIPAAGYSAFSEDLCTGWLLHSSATPLAPSAPEGYVGLYQHRLCPEGPYTPLNVVTPPTQESDVFLPEFQGASTDGSRAIFIARDQLAPEANPAGGLEQVYEWHEGSVEPVCYLPNETLTTEDCAAGWVGSRTLINGFKQVDNAISDDGSHVFFTTYSANANPLVPGKLYVRIDGMETIPVSTTVSNEPARFWMASPDGARAIFTSGGNVLETNAPGSNLYTYETANALPSKIAGRTLGVVGASEDLSRVYFVSREVKDAGATDGAPNLYLWEEGVGYEFVATLGALDAVANGALSVDNLFPVQRTSRVTPDGQHLAFMSQNALTGVENRDLESEEADANIFLYDAGTDGLICASCNPTGARPHGRRLVQVGLTTAIWAAARIPTWSTQLYPGRPLSDDGQRLFFESFDRLVAADTNGKADVYQWEAQGKGDCAEPDGCVVLISDGKSTRDSHFLDASPSGNDVFISTASSLVPIDPGNLDVYDARVGGGFSYPQPIPDCEEAGTCQSPPPPPAVQNPNSGSGGSNVKERKCPKGKRKVVKNGIAKCVKKKHKKHHKARKHHKRGAAR